MRNDSTASSSLLNRHSSTPVAFSEKIAKLTPCPSHVAPSGYGWPGQTLIEFLCHPERQARDDNHVEANNAADHAGKRTDCFVGSPSRRFGPSSAGIASTYDAMRSSPPYVDESLEKRTDHPRSPAPGSGTFTSRSEQ